LAAARPASSIHQHGRLADELRLVELGCRVIEVNGLIMQMVAENNLLRDDHRVTFVGLKKANP
jgi:hypothetical protein